MENQDLKETTDAPRRRRRRSHRPPTPAPVTESETRFWYYIGTFCFALLLLLLTETHLVTEWRVGCAYSGMLIMLFLVFLSVDPKENPWKLLVLPPNLFQILLILWTIGESVVSPLRPFAIMESARIMSGAAAFFFAAYALHTRRGAFHLAGSISLVVVIFAMIDFTQFPSTSESASTTAYSGFFGTHETLGTLVLLALPVCGAVAAHFHIRDQWRFISLGVFLILLVALIVARCRSAWIGAVAGVLIWAIVLWICRPSDVKGSPKEYRPILFGGIAAFLVVLIALATTEKLSAVTDRVNTLTKVQDVRDADPTRILKWNAGAQMLHERPLIGSGPGSYLVLQAHWTHQGYDPVEVLNGDIRHENIAHNYYIQWAADTGAVGVFLHFAAVLSTALFLAVGIPKMKKDSLRQAIALGSLASLAAGSVDAIASPSYNFPGLYTLYWGIAGMGVGAILSMTLTETITHASDGPFSVVAPATIEPTLSLRIPPIVWPIGIIISGVCTYGLLYWGNALAAVGDNHPRGHFTLVRVDPSKLQEKPSGPVWTAVYADADGVPQPTSPGTIWSLTSSDRANEPKFTQGEQAFCPGVPFKVTVDSRVEVTGPPAPATVQLKAAYRDQWGRLYETSTSTQVIPTK